ncbi:MAG: nucleotide exchange factor GrpE [Pseudomonadota bacterium]|nr:nucleotide exchange factor GrpE [Pseudomonadota bacterium]
MSNEETNDIENNIEAPNATEAVSADALKPSSDMDSTALEEKIAALEETNAALQSKNTYLTAELHNLGTRLKKDFDRKQTYAITNFAKEILDVGDILATGLDNCADKESEHYQGMEMTLDKFYIILKQHGITPIDSLGTPFNHDIHEALTSQESDEHEPGIVIQVIQKGYQFKERVLRPAKVIVSKKVSQDS